MEKQTRTKHTLEIEIYLLLFNLFNVQLFTLRTTDLIKLNDLTSELPIVYFIYFI